MPYSLPSFKSRRGNALFLILIAIALFAALSYGITRSSRSGGASSSREKNKLIAQQLLDICNEIRVGVQRMTVLQGISVEDIDYSETGTGTSALFSATGGGVKYRPAPGIAFNSGNDTDWSFEKPSFGYILPDATNTNPDGIIWVQGSGIKDDICKAFNTLTGHAYEIPQDGAMTAYNGEIAYCYKEGLQPPEIIFGYWVQ